jgi:hypothetical protein
MKHGERMLICSLAGLALCMPGNAVAGDAAGNPYQGIVDRNVFGLKPPPPPPDPESNKPPPPKIFLTGITTILGNKRALLKTTPPAKPGEPAKEQSFTLGEGQREGDIEVLEIDEKAGTVKVNDYGTIATLDFDKDGVKGTPGAPPAPGGAPTHPAGFAPTPGANPFVPARGANPTLPRPMRLPTSSGGASASTSGGVTPAYGGGVPGLALGGTSVPLGGFASASAPASPTASQSQQDTAPPLTQEQLALVLMAQKQHYQDMGSPIANLIPPVPGEQPGAAATGSTPGTTTPRTWTPPRAPTLPPLPQ